MTYELQIDDHSSFSSPLLHEVGITGSGYTLTSDEALPNGIYFWRVGAVDGAGNASAWGSGYLKVTVP